MRMPPGGPKLPPIDPISGLPTDFMEALEELATESAAARNEIVLFMETLAGLMNIFTRINNIIASAITMNVEFQQSVVDANRAVIEYYQALRNVYSAIPAATTAFSQFSQAISDTATTTANLASNITSLGAAFYDGLIAPALQAGNATALISGAIGTMSQLINIASTGLENIKRLISDFAGMAERAIAAITGPLESVQRAFVAAASSAGEAINAVESAVTRGAEATQNFVATVSGTADVLGRAFNQNMVAVTATLDAYKLLLNEFSNAAGSVIRIIRAQLALFVAEWQTAFTELLKQMQPIIVELTKVQQVLQGVANVVGFVSQMVGALGQLLGTTLQIFGNFVSTWLNLIQALAPIQQGLNVIGVNIRDLSQEVARGTTVLDTYTNALNAVVDVGRRALLTFSALQQAVTSFNTAGLIPSTRLIGQMADAVAALAQRLGVLPDELATAVQQFALGGDELRRFLPTLTRGALEIAMLRQFGMWALPAPLAVPFALQFAQQAVQAVLPAGGAPATLVMFQQEMRALGQQLQALFARAEPFGGAEILADIRNLIRELVQGEIGQNLRAFFRFISTGIAAGLQAFLHGFAQLARSPALQELGRGIGAIIYAIGAAFRDVLGEQLAALDPARLRQFFIDFAANIYAFIRAGMQYVGGLIQALINFFSNMFVQGGIFQFITSIIGMFNRAIQMGTRIGEAVTTMAAGFARQLEGVINTVGTIVYWLRVIGSAVTILVGIAVTIAGIFFIPTVIGAIIGIGAGVSLIAGGFYSLIGALRGRPERLVEELGLRQFREEMEGLRDEFRQWGQDMAQAGLSPQNFNRALQRFSQDVTQLNQQVVQSFVAYRDQFRSSVQNFVAGMNDAAQAARQFVRNIIQYVEPMFRPLMEVGQLASEMRRRFAPTVPLMTFVPVAPGGVMPSLPVGALEVIFGGQPPAAGALLEMLPRQMQVAATARILQFLRTLPPELVAGIPAGEIQRLWRDLISNIQQDLQTAQQVLAESIELATARITFFESRLRLEVATGADVIGATLRNINQALRMTAESAYELGMSFVMLEQIRAAYPGIEQTIAFQRLYNEILQQTIRLIELLAERYVRTYEVARRAALILGDTFAEAAAWGYELSRLWEGLASLLAGRLENIPTLIEAGIAQLRPTFENLIAAIGGAWESMLVSIRLETARAFQQLLAGNIEGFLDNLRSVTQRILQLPEEYINRFRQLASIAIRPLNYMLDVLNEIRGTLGTVGAEMALFPFILSRAIPSLIEMRNQWQAVAAQAAQVGDILSFTEALRNVNELQRRIMELLGVTGMFLPAYTPEQMMRMFVRIGLPGLAEIRELARGGFMLEPAMFRAVPIPLAQFFGLPAPAWARVRPDIFGGFPFLWAGLQMLTPEAITMGFRQLQQEGLAEMFPPLLQTLRFQEQFSRFLAVGYRMGRELLGLYYPGFAITQQQMLNALVQQLGGAIPPWLLGGFLPPMPPPFVGMQGLLGLSPLAAPLGWGQRQEQFVTITVAREISDAVSALRTALRELNLRFRTEPLQVEIPVEIDAVDANTGETLQRLSRTLQIRLLPHQPL